jgi:lipopolysaccharide export system protein LptA
MRRPNIRALQTALLVAVAAMLVLVIASLRRPKPGPMPAPTPGASEAPNPGTPRMEGFVIRKLDKDGKEKFVLKAQSMAGQEQDEVRMRGVTMTFPYVSRGAAGNASISAEACVYTPASQKAVFKGSVVVKTEDGLELETDALTYRGDKGVVRTDSLLTFARKDVSGSSTGAVYHSGEGRLELVADARLRVEADESGPALEIQSKSAALDREEGALRFDGDAQATRGPDVLKGGQITLVYSTEDQSLLGLSAADKIELRTAGATAIPGMPASARGGGPRVLKAARLDVTFRKDRSLEDANAGPDAELTILPGRGGPKERHRLKAKFLTFHFDEKGRLQEFEGQREATLAIEAIPPARGEPRTIDCRSFAARLDPETGETKNIDFRNDVVIAKGTQKAKADSAWYDGAKSRLTLEKDPEVVDQRDGSRLSAVKIDIGTESGNVDAFREVRHLLGKSAGGPRRMPLGSSEEPTLVTCGVFSFEAKTKTTRYLEGAVLRSGKDEIRAPTLRVIEDKTGKHRLSATEDVVSLFHPKPAPGKPPPAAVETHAKQLAYDESTGQAVYTGDVVIRQADLVSKSPEATMTLAPDGSQIQTVVAGEPVEIQQGARKATGTRATYTPASETLVIVGDKVVLKDPAQEVVGRSLTFHVGDDRILVDGREEVRTETILKKEPPKP